MKIKANGKELITYVIFGVLSTVVSWGSYALCENAFHFGVGVSNFISWLLAIAFAFITNKLWVFGSKSFERKLLFREIATFFSSRVVTGIVELVAVPLLARTGVDNVFYGVVQGLKLDGISLLMTPGIYSKILVSVIVIILNYIFSKLFVFKTKERYEN